MLKKILILLGLSLSLPINAATVSFNSSLQSSGTTAIPWVAGSTMWGHIDSSTGFGQSMNGFSSLAGKDLNLFSFRFGGLDLTSYSSPGSSTPGFEMYTGATEAFEFYYSGQLWATGTTHSLRTEVQNKYDTDAIGAASITLETSGVDSAFFNEILALTGGTGTFTMTASSFIPVNSQGRFTAITTIELPSPVPAPAAVWLFGSALIALTGIRRKKLKALIPNV